ncbi:MAG: hypothetical protein HGA38_03090 [Candidatus Moranbacteria bacterium]|nr:hypothetical protein [Candidatus Moranbacteria bacterium]
MDRSLKILKKEAKSIALSAVAVFVFLLVFQLREYFSGEVFVWKSIKPLSAPSFWNRAFYSAFTFFTFGAFLYWIKFYKLLYAVLVDIFDARRLYESVKGLLWIALMWVSYHWTIPAIFDGLNLSASIVFNLLSLSLYLLPPVGISMIVTLALWYIIVKNESNPTRKVV